MSQDEDNADLKRRKTRTAIYLLITIVALYIAVILSK